jgi:hypothetical protein
MSAQEHLALLGGQAKGLLLGMLLVPEARHGYGYNGTISYR